MTAVCVYTTVGLKNSRKMHVLHILFCSPLKDRAPKYTDPQCRELHHIYEYDLGRGGQNNGNV